MSEIDFCLKFGVSVEKMQLFAPSTF